MMQAAVTAAKKRASEISAPAPLVVGVTVLTSEKSDAGTLPLVLERARLAKTAGLDGVVASCHEAAAVRKEMGEDFVIVTPGIRPEGEKVQDQKRVATPQEAIRNGSNFLVVGRPIVSAADPVAAAKTILASMN